MNAVKMLFFPHNILKVNSDWAIMTGNVVGVISTHLVI